MRTQLFHFQNGRRSIDRGGLSVRSNSTDIFVLWTVITHLSLQLVTDVSYVPRCDTQCLNPKYEVMLAWMRGSCAQPNLPWWAGGGICLVASIT